jgi:hypothetical protein
MKFSFHSRTLANFFATTERPTLNSISLFFNHQLSFLFHVTTDNQSASLSWNKAPIWGFRLDFHYCQTIAGLLIWGALSINSAALRFSLYSLGADPAENTVSNNTSIVGR